MYILAVMSTLSSITEGPNDNIGGWEVEVGDTSQFFVQKYFLSILFSNFQKKMHIPLYNAHKVEVL